MAAPSRPPPPVVGKVTHHSVELYWIEALESLKGEMQKGDGRVRAVLQEQDQNGAWNNCYTGYAKRHVMDNLEPLTQYRYRLQLKNNHGGSEMSPMVAVSTTKEPLTGDHLHRAVNLRTLDQLENILDTGDVVIDVPDKYGNCPLMNAASKGYIDVMDVLIARGADVNWKNDSGKTALMMACYTGKLESVERLRQAGASYDITDKAGCAAIHSAIDGKNSELIEWILDDGADVNTKELSTKWTPLLRCASVNGNVNVASTLIKQGAELDIKDADGKTALMIAVVNGHQPLVELLLSKNADVQAKNEFGKTVIEMAHSMDRQLIIRTMNEHMTRHGLKGTAK
ncbi:unnamed protein product [Owenia fusiformis]|uniref:Uncharacterized protein n=1 Tax=Owenia fusiformis TaxID=6347 RepID=A0A8J1XGT6_OWEFU|nr:unnamed protein product [Owenia fusiformis]